MTYNVFGGTLNIALRIWPVSPEYISAGQKWTFLVGAFESYRTTYIQTNMLTDATETVTTPLRGW